MVATMENIYPTPKRDTQDKLADCNSRHGQDYLHEDMPSAPSATGDTASPKPAPKSPEGLS